jgi:hypothetical protein
MHIYQMYLQYSSQSINKDGKKHVRKPIDLSELDEIGHGVVVPDEPRPVPLHQSQNFNNIVGRDKQTMPREKSRDARFNSSLKQNGAGPPRGGALCGLLFLPIGLVSDYLKTFTSRLISSANFVLKISRQDL